MSSLYKIFGKQLVDNKAERKPRSTPHVMSKDEPISNTYLRISYFCRVLLESMILLRGFLNEHV